jgi:hypothetical protein
MSEADVKILIREVSRKVAWKILYILVPSLLAFGTMIVTDHFKLKNMDELKINKEEAYKYWTDVQLLVERKNALFEQYITDDAADKEELKRRMESIENEIREIYKHFNPIRGSSSDELPDPLGHDYVREVAMPQLLTNAQKTE